MQSSEITTARDDGHLWVIALGLSLIANTAIVATAGVAMLESAKMRENARLAPEAVPQVVAMIFPDGSPEPLALASDARDAPAARVSPRAMAPSFAQTDESQNRERPERPGFFGERDTRATSDRTPDPTAAPMPSQSGVAPKNEMDLKTTQSDPRDGRLGHAPPAPPAPGRQAEPSPAMAATQEAPNERNETDDGPDTRSASDVLRDSPDHIDVPVARDEASHKPHRSAAAAAAAASKADQVRQGHQAAFEPNFKGDRSKTAMTGSITRTGRSALDVADSPLGRYQAALSRAVEQEWQRNCVRHRDYITPGFLTVRFFVEPGGKVRSVKFVGDMETGEVQKGFTLKAIRDAEIPVMPPALRKEYDQEPLELVFRFYF